MPHMMEPGDDVKVRDRLMEIFAGAEEGVEEVTEEESRARL